MLIIPETHGIQNKIFHVQSSTNVADIIPTDMLRRHLANGGNTWFHLPECVFIPDQWTTAFLQGLDVFGKRGGFSRKRVVELGTGSGINLVLVKSLFDPAEMYGSDIHHKVPEVALRNVSHNLPWRKKSGVRIVSGGHNLGKWMEEGFMANIIIGCLPQVVVPIEKRRNFMGSRSESSSHYYNPKDYPLASEISHQWGLGLNDHALKELSGNLAPGGQVILNLGGRPGHQRLLSMFHENGFQAETLYSELVEQHVGTSISTLVQQEQSLPDDSRFEFFDDSGRQISATEAEILRKNRRAIFHKIYVIVGTKKF